MCYILLLPMFAQLQFKNYYTETFIHVVNILGKWPIAFRQLLGSNCSVNMSGKRGCGIELDAFVEAEIVQPLKSYVSGDELVHMLFSWQFLDEVEHDTENYQGRSLCYLPQHNTNLGLDNSQYHEITLSNTCFITHY